MSGHEPDEILVQAFAKLDKIALGAGVGSVFGLGVFGATLILVLKGGDNVGSNLGLLSQYFVGYDVTAPGAVLGLLYGFLTGFLLGFFFAALRNTLIVLYAAGIRAKQELTSLDDFLDHM